MRSPLSTEIQIRRASSNWHPGAATRVAVAVDQVGLSLPQHPSVQMRAHRG
jgi:hypothetical protein